MGEFFGALLGFFLAAESKTRPRANRSNSNDQPPFSFIIHGANIVCPLK